MGERLGCACQFHCCMPCLLAFSFLPAAGVHHLNLSLYCTALVLLSCTAGGAHGGAVQEHEPARLAAQVSEPACVSLWAAFPLVCERAVAAFRGRSSGGMPARWLGFCCLELPPPLCSASALGSRELISG